MTFWDSSAVVPLVVEEEHSSRATEWMAADTILVLWTLTPIEVTSALRRLFRENALDDEATQAAEARIEEIVRASHVVGDVEPVKSLAARLLRLHPLRAFDALQLGAAIHWAEGHPLGRTLHTFDKRLASAARREGFIVPS